MQGRKRNPSKENADIITAKHGRARKTIARARHPKVLPAPKAPPSIKPDETEISGE